MSRVFLPQFGGEIVEPYHDVNVPAEHAHKFTWCIVRNPYDRVLSAWYHIRAHSQDPEWRQRGLIDFVHALGRVDWWVNQAEYMKASRMDAVLRWEDLAQEIHRLPFVPADVSLPTQRVNEEPRGPWAAEATPAFVIAVNELCGEDFEMLDYERLGYAVPEYTI